MHCIVFCLTNTEILTLKHKPHRHHPKRICNLNVQPVIFQHDIGPTASGQVIMMSRCVYCVYVCMTCIWACVPKESSEKVKVCGTNEIQKVIISVMQWQALDQVKHCLQFIWSGWAVTCDGRSNKQGQEYAQWLSWHNIKESLLFLFSSLLLLCHLFSLLFSYGLMSVSPLHAFFLCLFYLCILHFDFLCGSQCLASLWAGLCVSALVSPLFLPLRSYKSSSLLNQVSPEIRETCASSYKRIGHFQR